jgi:hypothetical protein
MDAIEPNWISLIWFAAFATICMVAFLIVAGMFPLGSRPDQVKSGAATLLVVGNGLLLSVLLVGTGLYGYAELRWSTLIVVTGLVVLFAPGLGGSHCILSSTHAWPRSHPIRRRIPRLLHDFRDVAVSRGQARRIRRRRSPRPIAAIDRV